MLSLTLQPDQEKCQTFGGCKSSPINPSWFEEGGGGLPKG